MTRQLSELSGTEFLVRTAGRQLEEIFDGEVVLYLREADGDAVAAVRRRHVRSPQEPINRDVAQWVADNGKIAGAGTDTLPNATAPVRAAGRLAAHRRRRRRAAAGHRAASSIPSSSGCWKRAPA